MSKTKGVKSLLKQTKHAIEKKEYKAALEVCAEVFNKVASEDQVYAAHLFCGFASFKLNKHEDAERHYNEACEHNAKPSDAWTGLHNLYSEMEPPADKDGRKKLIGDRIRVLGLLVKKADKKGSSKWRKHSSELASLFEETNDLDRAKDVLEKVLSEGDLLDGDAPLSGKTVGVFGKYALLCERLADAEYKEALEAKYIEIQRKDAEKKVPTRKRRSRGADAELKLEPLTDERKAKIVRHVRREFFKKTEIDDLLRKLAEFEETSDPVFHEHLIKRCLERAELAKDAEELAKLHGAVITECQAMSKAFPDETMPLITGLQAVLDIDASSERISIGRVWADRLLELAPTSGLGYVAKGATLCVGEGADFEGAEELLRFALVGDDAAPSEFKADENSDSVEVQQSLAYAIGWCWLAYIIAQDAAAHDRETLQVGVNAFKRAARMLASCSEFDARASRALVHVRLSLAEIFMTQSPKKREQAKRYFEEATSDESTRVRGLQGLCKLAMASSDFERARTTCDNLIEEVPGSVWARSLKGWLLYLDKDLEGATEILQEGVALCKEQRASGKIDSLQASETYERLGVVYWDRGGTFRSDRSRSRAQFMEAVKLNGRNATAFAYLGQFYRLVEGNADKARRCYLKALDLDATCRLAGVILSNMYSHEDEGVLSRQLCEAALEKDATCAWAARRLASILLSSDELDKAVAMFLVAIRASPKDAQLWEGLADSYLAQAKFVPAIKSLRRACDLSPGVPTRKFKLASALFEIHEKADAFNLLEEIVTKDPSFVPATRLYAECLLHEAKFSVREGSFALAFETLDRCVYLLRTCLRSDPQSNVFSIHKLLGDTLYAFTLLSPTKYGEFPANATRREIEEHLALLVSRIDDADSAYDAALGALAAAGEGPHGGEGGALEAAEEGGASSGEGATRAGVWHDRGVCALRCASLYEQLYQTEEARRFFDKAAEHLTRAVELSPRDGRLWATLAAAKRHDADAQHHCFLKAVEYEKDATSRINLALFYLKHGKRDLARLCLKQAQALDPSRAALWLTQSLFNEFSPSDGALDARIVEQALSTYERALELLPTPSSRYGAGRCASRVGRADNARFQLTKYAEQNMFDARAWNALGVARAKTKRHASAAQAFRNSLLLIDSFGAEQDQPQTKRRRVARNLAHSLARSGDPSGGLALAKQTAEAETEEKATSGGTGAVLQRTISYELLRGGDRAAASQTLNEVSPSSARDANLKAVAEARMVIHEKDPREALVLVASLSSKHLDSAELSILQAIASHRAKDAAAVQTAMDLLARRVESETDAAKADDLRYRVVLLQLLTEPENTRTILSAALHERPHCHRTRNLYALVVSASSESALLGDSGSGDRSGSGYGHVQAAARFSTQRDEFDGEEAGASSSSDALYVDRLEGVARASLLVDDTDERDPSSVVRAAARLVFLRPQRAAHRRVLGRALHARAALTGDVRHVDAAAKVLSGCNRDIVAGSVEAAPDSETSHKQATFVNALMCADLARMRCELGGGDDDASLACDLSGDVKDLATSKTSKSLLRRHDALDHLMQGRTADAIKEYEAAVGECPANVALSEELAALHGRLGNHDGALACLERALDSRGRRPLTDRQRFRLLMRIAYCHLERNKPYEGAPRALEALELPVAQDPSLRRGALFLRAVCLRRNNKKQNALNVLSDPLLIPSRYVDARTTLDSLTLCELAAFQASKKQFKEAESTLARAFNMQCVQPMSRTSPLAPNTEAQPRSVAPASRLRKTDDSQVSSDSDDDSDALGPTGRRTRASTTYANGEPMPREDDDDNDLPPKWTPNSAAPPRADSRENAQREEKAAEAEASDERENAEYGLPSDAAPAQRESEAAPPFPRELVAFARRFHEWNQSTNADAFGDKAAGSGLTEKELQRLEQMAERRP